MKKHQLLVGALVLLVSASAYGQTRDIYINNKKLQMDVTPEVKENITYVPISFISKELGAVAKWENPNVIITKDHLKIRCTVGSTKAYKNGKEVTLTAAPYSSSNRIVVPLRSISELLDCEVGYKNNNIYINQLSEAKGTTVVNPGLNNEKLESKLKALNALDSCVVDKWVYYVVLGEKEGFHKMLLDGSQDQVICDFTKVKNIDGSTAVSSEYKEGVILYKFQKLSQYDENNKPTPPQAAEYYKLNLADNTLEPVNP